MVVALAGGVGGAKLAQGLMACLSAQDLTVVVNTADDFDIYGLRVCPDLDTVMYTLAGIANVETGWGVGGDTFDALDMIGRYGEDTWFRIGDRDLATDVLRTHWLRQGLGLSEVTRRLATALGVGSKILPMSDDPVATWISTPEGALDFQEYFVRRHHEPVVTGVAYMGIEQAKPAPGLLSLIDQAELIVFCPSNPIVSISPILAVPGVQGALRAARAPKIAVSPIVGGQAIRGPADRMLESLGHEVSSLGVARMYRGTVNAMVIDEADRELEGAIRDLGVRVLVAQTVMRDESDKRDLAGVLLNWGRSLASGAGQ